jgi:hypothetical protein
LSGSSKTGRFLTKPYRDVLAGGPDNLFSRDAPNAPPPMKEGLQSRWRKGLGAAGRLSGS